MKVYLYYFGFCFVVFLLYFSYVILNEEIGLFYHPTFKQPNKHCVQVRDVAIIIQILIRSCIPIYNVGVVNMDSSFRIR